MSENPLLTLLLVAVGLWIAWMWLQDYRFRQRVDRTPSLPGATGCPVGVVLVGVATGIMLVAAETAGESWLGITHEQSTITALFALWTLVAAIVEEIIFRGFLVIERRGAAMLWAGVLLFSVAFAALHPFLWEWDDSGFRWTPGIKGWFSTGFAFAGSIAFYSLRFNRWNRALSLLPCIAAHLAKNVGVIAVKAAQGFVS